jgi:hypothetical protein
LELPIENSKSKKNHGEIDSTLSTEKMQSLTDTTEPNYSSGLPVQNVKF